MIGGSGFVIYKRKSSCTHSTDHTHNIQYSLCRSLLYSRHSKVSFCHQAVIQKCHFFGRLRLLNKLKVIEIDQQMMMRML